MAGACLSSLVTHSGSPQEAPVVLWSSPDDHSSLLASTALVPGSSGCGGDGPVALLLSRDLLRQPHFHRHHLGCHGRRSCLETIQQFAQAKGFSKHVAK